MPTSSISHAVHRSGARHIAIFVALSLLIHGLLFFAIVRWPHEEKPRAGETRQPLSVRLLQAAPAPPQPQSPPPVASAVPRAQPKPAHKRENKPSAKPATKPPRRHATEPALAQRTPSKVAKSEHAEKAEPKPPETRSAPPETDMLSMLNAARERRRAAMENETPQEKAAPEDDVAMANIRRDLQRYSGARTGMGNVYVRLTRTGVRTAQFQIRGSNPVSGDRWSQTIDVDAGPDGDVQQATVQKMIEWIRAHYSGDFNWESHRMDRVFTLSARPRDTAELQAFLMREFFSS